MGRGLRARRLGELRPPLYAAPVGALGFNDNSIDVHIHPAARVGDPPVVTGEPASSFYTIENRAVTGPAGAPKTFDLTREPGTNRVVAYGTLPLDAEPDVEYFAVVDPARWAATVFGEVLERRGIEIDGPVRTISRAADSPVAAGDTVALAAHVGQPLAQGRTVLGRSQNWHAEQLLKTIGREVAGEGTWDAGSASNAARSPGSASTRPRSSCATPPASRARTS